MKYIPVSSCAVCKNRQQLAVGVWYCVCTPHLNITKHVENKTIHPECELDDLEEERL